MLESHRLGSLAKKPCELGSLPLASRLPSTELLSPSALAWDILSIIHRVLSYLSLKASSAALYFSVLYFSGFMEFILLQRFDY